MPDGDPEADATEYQLLWEEQCRRGSVCAIHVDVLETSSWPLHRTGCWALVPMCSYDRNGSTRMLFIVCLNSECLHSAG